VLNPLGDIGSRGACPVLPPDLIVLDTLGKLYTQGQRPQPLRHISWILAPRLVALAGVLALTWLVGLLWPPGAPPPAAIPVAAPVDTPAIVVPPVAPAMAPVPASERPGPAPDAAAPSEPFALPSEPAAPPAALELAPLPPSMPAIAALPEPPLEPMSDARRLNLLELRRIERTLRRPR
jgi:hypothetical protein